MGLREYCKLYFHSNGGEFTDTGMPIFRKGVRALCRRPFDCYDCTLMQRWLEVLPADGWTPSWECTECLEKSRRLPDNVARELQGFYQSGRPAPGQGDPLDTDEDRPSLIGCPVCGYPTFFLQLVLRRAT
jgi:hypothetical protein